jgi:hypothetical protein
VSRSLCELSRKAIFQKIIIALSILVIPALGYPQVQADVQALLLEMKDLDQQRGEIRNVEERYGYNSPEYISAWEKQNAIDSENLKKLSSIVEQWGWPKISEVGAEAANAAFLIVQHSDLEGQKKYLPEIKQAAMEGEASKRSFALLQDRILMNEGKPTIYGTQLRRNEETGEWFLWPVEDEANVDQVRAELGMEPLGEELKRYPFEITPVPAGFVMSSDP